jgi:hypothetical protein
VRRLLGLPLVTALVAAVLTPSTSLAEVEPTPAFSWVANGSVWATTRSDQTIYLGGSFTEISPPTGNAALFDPISGAPAPAPLVQGTVRDTLALPTGGWILGGSFTRVNNGGTTGLARLQADGTTAPWGTSSATVPKVGGGSVNVVALSPDGSRLYVGGTFTSMKNKTRNRLAAFALPSGNLVGTWTPSVDGAVGALAVSPDGATVFAGGEFTQANGQARARIAAFSAVDGTLVSGDWNAGATAPVNALEALGSTLYVAGGFTQLGGAPRARLGAFDLATGTLTSWDPGADAAIQAMDVTVDRVLVGGSFTTLGGQPRGRLGAVDLAGLVTTWAPEADGVVRSVADDMTRILVGGDFLNVGGQPLRRLAALDPVSGGADPAFDPNPNRTVLAVAADAAAILAGGIFSGAGGVIRNGLAALDISTGMATAWDPSPNGTVYALATSPDGTTVYAGGTFTKMGPSSRNNLAGVDATTGAATSTLKAGTNGRVRSLALGTFTPVGGDPVTRLYVGGDFTKVAQQDRVRLAAIVLPPDPQVNATLDDIWSPSATNTDPAKSALVRSIGIAGDGWVFVGGDFTTISGVSEPNLAALDPVTGAIRVGFNPNASANGATMYKVIQLSVAPCAQPGSPAGSCVYVAMGGPGGQARSYDQTDGRLYWNQRGDGDIQAVVPHGGQVFVGGHFDYFPWSFSSKTGTRRGSIAVVDELTGALDSTWDPGANGGVWTLTSGGDRILIGGTMLFTGGLPREGFAMYVDQPPAP